MRAGWRQVTVIALAVAAACLLLALLLPGGSAPARPRAAATRTWDWQVIPGPGTVTDPLGATCAATAAGGDGFCPGSGSQGVTDGLGASCPKRDMDQGWCPGDMPSWPPPAPAATPGTVTFTVRGSAASVSYGPGPASLAGSSPMTVTLPLEDVPDYELAVQAAPGGEVTAAIWVNGQQVTSVTAGDGDGVAVAEAVPSAAYDGDWVAAGGN